MTKPFGELIGEYLAALTDHGLAANRLEMLGASLGAHISSYAAEKFMDLTGTKLNRLSGTICFIHRVMKNYFSTMD